MQKKLIAVAVASAALTSGAALAQTNVQIYGVVDAGFSTRGDNLVDGVGSKNSIDSGISAGNRIGFTGTEDLGNGLKALFTLEAGFNVDDGAQRPNASQMFGRQAFVGLTGGFGTAIMGRLYAPHYSFLSAIDPFKAGTVGTYRNVFASGINAGGENLFDPTRVDNAVAYVSPSWGGFNVTVAYSNNAIGQETLENAGDNTVVAVLPRYTNGPLDIGLSYHKIESDDSSTIDISNWAIGGTYDFSVLKFHAFYDNNKYNDVLGMKGVDHELKTWLLGVTVPFGKHAIQGSYTQSKMDGDLAEGKSKQWAVGYTYALSKRTSFYAAYADINNDKDRELDKELAPGYGTIGATIGDNSNAGAGYQDGLQFGIKHTF